MKDSIISRPLFLWQACRTEMKDHLSPAASYQGQRGHFAQFASRLTFKGPQVDGRGRGEDRERGEGDPEEVNLLAQDGVGGAGVDLSCVLKVWFVFFLVLGATPKK